MARPLRLPFPGGIYHVTARGNEKRPIFSDDADCHGFLRLLATVVDRYHILCHAYCLMNNHYHLLLETPDANLSSAMRQLNGVYSQRFNHRHSRSGHLFGGRFHAVVVERDAHLREVSRYIVLNPVRAGLVADAAEWSWSSYLATVGDAPQPGFLTIDWLLALGGHSERVEAQRAYRAFVSAGLGQAAVADSGTGGDGEVVRPRSLLRVLASDRPGSALREIPRAQRFAGRPPLSDIFSGVESRAVRDARCAVAVRLFGYTLRELADFLDLHYATVSRALGRSDNLGQEMSQFKT
ncbi:MAG TPA: transposase [Methylomirabilota bacterium]|jgi:REP element-mobilizing transposase RayT|nr:transposase [Methylomirabilota bacterium]